MARVEPVIRLEIDPLQPVPEICAVIMSVVPYNPGQEEAILQGVKEAVEQRIAQLKGAEKLG
ncbi:hypothetical protein [Cohnella sp. AR92]|uniref:hypothetical protein n=1 Tax=Cohnella sp. AR92 TaxID=648716 RepID=UPI000F8C7ED4|nr:hypothetical protein [Cohnella sp. AR92]RUS47571.1 hypothetical protein ELR57_07185 [Cohnella sp. AR92]